MDDPIDEENGARILVSFTIADFDSDFKVAAEDISLDKQVMDAQGNKIMKMPDLGIESYNIVINALGLRSLVSTGLLPIKKAYVKFSVKSLLPPEQAKAVNDIFTIPDESGSDPNIRTVMKFTVNISQFPEYCPAMTCTTYDKLYFDGMSQPILGVFRLALGEILARTRAIDATMQGNLEKFRNQLATILEKKTGEENNRTVIEIMSKYTSYANPSQVVL